jgi:NTE family protein
MRKIVLVICVLCFLLSSSAQKIGICLSGGGALGYAEIGALKALEEAGIKPDVISGCSIGSIIGVFYAAGYSPDSIWQIIQKEDMLKFSKMFHAISGNKTGFSKHKRLRQILDKYIKTNDFDSLPISLYVCVADFRNGECVHANKGNHLKDYVIASASIPVLFESVEINGIEFIDGGVLDNFPIEPLIKDSCDVIIGIDVLSLTPYTEPLSGKERINHIFALMMEAQTRPKHALCNHYIAIKGTNIVNNGVLDFNKSFENYQQGYQQTKQYIEEYLPIK